MSLGAVCSPTAGATEVGAALAVHGGIALCVMTAWTEAEACGHETGVWRGPGEQRRPCISKSMAGRGTRHSREVHPACLSAPALGGVG